MNTKKLFDKKRIEEIIRLYSQENKSAVEIRKIFGCSDSTIKNYLKRNRIKLRTKREYMKLAECSTRFKKGQKSPNYKNGKCIKKGYMYIYIKNKGYVQEHCLVMEQHLGRYLRPKEIIHNIDGNILNNSIKNLHLFSNDKNHQIYHRRIRNFIMKEIGNRWKQNTNGSGKVRFVGDRNFKEFGRCRLYEIQKGVCKETKII